MIPSVSVVVCTYARTALLAECIESYRRQSYGGATELLILNDCAWQTLVCDVPGVRIINIRRYPNLGTKRQAAAAAAEYDLVLTVDDDDVFLPWFVDVMVTYRVSRGRPVYPGSHFFSTGLGDKLQVTFKPTPLPGVFLAGRDEVLKANWGTANSGVDQHMRGRLTNLYGIALCERAGYVYRWGNGAFHISGNPKVNGWDATEKNALARRDLGLEPAGTIVIEPRWSSAFDVECERALAVGAYDRRFDMFSTHSARQDLRRRSGSDKPNN